MSLSLTAKQQEVLAGILSASVHLYGWASAQSMYHNRVSIGNATDDCRKMTPYDTLEQKGLVTLHTCAKGDNSAHSSISHVEITKAGIEPAKKAFDKYYVDPIEQYLEHAKNNRK